VDDPYTVLGLSRDASGDDIRAAYRKLAKQHHPDLNPGNPQAEARFKAISAANEILSDPEKRGKFDRGEIDAAGDERERQPSYGDYAHADTGRSYGRGGTQAGGWSHDDLRDIFGSMFDAEGAPVDDRPMQGRDERYALTIDFLEAIRGANRRLTLPDGRVLVVTIPPGLADGQVLRLRGRGGAGRNEGGPGDALIEVSVAKHPYFTREGQDIRMVLPVTLSEAVLGGFVEAPTPSGPLSVRIPAGSDTGTELRLRGKGAPKHGKLAAGDLYATLQVKIGPPDAALNDFLRDWKPLNPGDPRQAMRTER
jgi:DnaJ-class molecular chaperone